MGNTMEDPSTKQLPRLRLGEYSGRGCRRIARAEGQRVCCKTVFPGLFRSYTQKVSPMWLPEHEQKRGSNRHARVDCGEPRSPEPFAKNPIQCLNWVADSPHLRDVSYSRVFKVDSAGAQHNEFPRSSGTHHWMFLICKALLSCSSNLLRFCD